MTSTLHGIERVNYLVGISEVSGVPLAPYDVVVCDFLSRLSIELRQADFAKTYPDVATFAFWCRKANILRLKAEFEDGRFRLGRGLVFHITPSNVPISFAFSFAFGLLAGNANVVRVPSNSFPQVDVVCDAVRRLIGTDEFSEIGRMNAFVRYERDDEVTAVFSKKCDARVIWGGDMAVRNVRKHSVSERCVDIVFGDRYSLCIMDARSVQVLDRLELERLAEDFYNDTYLMDQNACSSPHLVVWHGEGKEAAKERFWQMLGDVVTRKYDLTPVKAVDRYTLLCEHAIAFDRSSQLSRHGSAVHRITIDSLPDNMETFRGRSGLFYEYDADEIDSLAHIVSPKYQTLTYFGVKRSRVADFVLRNRLRGIDRIVPVGRALDIDVIWDGYEVVKTLSRVIDVR